MFLQDENLSIILPSKEESPDHSCGGEYFLLLSVHVVFRYCPHALIISKDENVAIGWDVDGQSLVDKSAPHEEKFNLRVFYIPMKHKLHFCSYFFDIAH